MMSFFVVHLVMGLMSGIYWLVVELAGVGGCRTLDAPRPFLFYSIQQARRHHSAFEKRNGPFLAAGWAQNGAWDQQGACRFALEVGQTIPPPHHYI